MMNLAATRDNHRLPQRLDQVGRQMLRHGAARHKRRSAARKVKDQIAKRENGSKRIPQPLVSARPVNSDASHRARVGVVRREVEIARIRVVVTELPVVLLDLGEMCAEDIADSLARNACELALVEALEEDIEAHGVCSGLSVIGRKLLQSARHAISAACTEAQLCAMWKWQIA
jgi:hypothetical protein